VLLHFNLLMQLELLSCKLWNLDRSIQNSPDEQQIRDRLFIFPFTHVIAGRSNVALIRWMMSLVVGITVIALPIFILLAAQIRFLPFHDEAITWSQRLAVWMDAVLLLALWPLIASPQDRALEWWQNAGYRLFGYWPMRLGHWLKAGWRLLIKQSRKPERINQNKDSQPAMHSGAEPKGMIVLLVSIPLAIFLSLLAVVPGSTTVQSYYRHDSKEPLPDAGEVKPAYLEDWLINRVPSSWLSAAVYQYDTVTCTTLPQAEKAEASIMQVMLGSCGWFNWNLFPRNLDLKEARLVPKEVTLSQITRATDQTKTVRDNAFKEFDGLNLQNRDLRFANMYGSVLPKADLRHVQLQGAVLLKARLQGVIGWDKTQLQGAILGGTQLQSAELAAADLRNADLRGADLQAADLSWTNLQSADLRGADLKGANLTGAKLQAADLRGANLQGSTLLNANLQGASLDYAKLQAADLSQADLSGAVLYQAELSGIAWPKAALNGIYIKTAESLVDEDTQLTQVEAALQSLMDTDKFTALKARIKNTDSLGINKPESRAGCYSQNVDKLDCTYRQPEQLIPYRQDAFFPVLIDLACSDVTLAYGIARRNSELSKPQHPNFGLVTALMQAVTSKQTCTGLAALPDETRDKLQAVANRETINH